MGAYPTPSGDSLEPLVARLQKIESELRDLQRPTGTSLGSLYEQVQLALADITNRVTDAVNLASMTRPDIEALVASPGAIAPTTVTASGAVSGDSGTFDGGIHSLDARNFTVVTNYASSWIDVNGHLGISASSVEYKQDFEAADMTALVDAILHVSLVRFRYIQACEELGELAPLELGGIAEYFAAAGLGEYVFKGADGDIMGINYERLSIPLIATVQRLHVEGSERDARMDALEERLVAAGY